MVVDKAAVGDSTMAASVARKLAEHRIASVVSKRSSDRYAHHVGRGAQGNPTAYGFGRTVCLATTDTGLQGGGMSGAKPDDVKPLIGARVSDVYDLEQGTSDEAISIELPLLDLVGKILERPVYELLGAKGLTQVSIYSSAIHFEDLEPWGNAEGIQRLLSMCRIDYDAGYRAFKLKIGRGFQWMPKEEGRRRDIEVTLAVRERFPDCKIIVDANNGYTCEDFLAYMGRHTATLLLCPPRGWRRQYRHRRRHPRQGIRHGLLGVSVQRRQLGCPR
jgi:L-alanine-DL-glutamate epimerase-like enolase superfamily enzyme